MEQKKTQPILGIHARGVNATLYLPFDRRPPTQSATRILYSVLSHGHVKGDDGSMYWINAQQNTLYNNNNATWVELCWCWDAAFLNTVMNSVATSSEQRLSKAANPAQQAILNIYGWDMQIRGGAYHLKILRWNSNLVSRLIWIKSYIQNTIPIKYSDSLLNTEIK